MTVHIFTYLKNVLSQRLAKTVLVSVHVTSATLGHVTSVMVPATVEMDGKVPIVQLMYKNAVLSPIYVEIIQCARKLMGHIYASVIPDISLQKDTVKVSFILFSTCFFSIGQLTEFHGLTTWF